MLVILPPDPGRKSKHLAVVLHRGGGWYDAACMGAAKACREGRCKHTASMVVEFRSGTRRKVKQVAREVSDGA